LYAEAVLVEDGNIIGVGSVAQFFDLADERVNLNGATMLPGFIDAHSHLSEYASAFLQADLSGISTFEGIRDAIQAHIKEKKIPKGEWVVARNYEHCLFPDSRKLSLDEIDSIAPSHLLLIKHTSCHMGLVNSRVFEKFGIGADSIPPKNGRYVTENGKLTGCVEENACALIRGKVPHPSIERVVEVHKRMQKYYASYGITTAHDGFLNGNIVEIYKRLDFENGFDLDILAYAPRNAYEILKDRMNSLPSGIKAKLGGIKYFLDGSPQLRTAWVRDEYVGGGNGVHNHTDEEVIEAFEFAAKHNAQMIVHANGDAAIAQFLRCLEKVCIKYPESKELRHTIIHGQLMGLDQLEQAKKLGVIVSFFVAHTYYFADTHVENLGEKRAFMISPTCSALQKGVIFNFHQDSPVIEPDMLESVWCAANRVTRKGVQLAKEECISVLDALRAITVNAAYQYFEENKKGSIESGKIADFVILDKDPLTVPKETIKEIKVLSTYKNGRKIFDMEDA
ncbi:MAG: amidohydrolase, partial [Clostridia bacterium]|nr:amidohydrolase [Clostridia bacterium]